MKLDLDVVRTNGRAARPVTAVQERALTREDVEGLKSERGVKPVPVKALRERHHQLARCLASGLSEAEAAITCGYHPSRVSILKADPAFGELLVFYSNKKEEAFTDFHELIATLRTEAVQLLLQKLDDTDIDDLTVKELRELAEFGADRTGFGPQRKEEHNHTFNIGSRLEMARKRMIDVTPTEGGLGRGGKE